LKYSGYFPIVQKELISPSIYKFTLDAGEIAKSSIPGQFVQIRASDGYVPLWPRPFSIHDVDLKNGYLSIMFRVYGSGTAQMASRDVGDLFHLLGPLGNGFSKLDDEKNVILAAGGVGLPPLYFLAKLAIMTGFRSNKITFIVGAKTKAELLNEPGLWKFDLKLILCTDDGSAGCKGTVVDILKLECDKDKTATVYACGPNAMLQRVDGLLVLNARAGYLSLEALMPCGYGICSGCAVKVAPPKDRGPTDDNRDYHLKRVCIDGPVLPSGEVLWD
jgi:dihydroorotate dehydrogenase electron transfer subunit